MHPDLANHYEFGRRSTRLSAVGGENLMEHRPARSRTEIDFLPPFSEPEVVTTGNAAADVALVGVGAAALVALASQN